MATSEIRPGQVWRYKEEGFWLVARDTAATVWLLRCNHRGKASGNIEFRTAKTTILRDFTRQK